MWRVLALVWLCAMHMWLCTNTKTPSPPYCYRYRNGVIWANVKQPPSPITFPQPSAMTGPPTHSFTTSILPCILSTSNASLTYTSRRRAFTPSPSLLVAEQRQALTCRYTSRIVGVPAVPPLDGERCAAWPATPRRLSDPIRCTRLLPTASTAPLGCSSEGVVTAAS